MGRNRRSTEFRNSSRVIDMEEARKKRQEKRQAERAREAKKAKRSAGIKAGGKTATRKRRNKNRTIVVAVVSVVFVVLTAHFIYNVVSLNIEKREAAQKQTELKAQKKDLEQQLKDIKDKSNLEEQARSQLRLVKPGESLYLFDDYLTKDSGGSDSKQKDSN